MPNPMGPRRDAAPGDNAPTTAPALAASQILKASKGILYGLEVTNTKASAQYIQLFDSATLPADTAVPLFSFPVAANDARTVDFGLRGKGFTNGIVVCNSSTQGTKTIGSADCIFGSEIA